MQQPVDTSAAAVPVGPVARSRRRRLESDERREQLLDVGLELFSTQPYDAVSVDDIAAATGASRGLLYHYFGSKRGFYIEVLRASVAELIEILQPAPDEDPVASLLQGLGDALVWIREHETGYLTVLTGGIGTDPEVAEIVEEVRSAIGQLVLLNVELREDARPLAEAHVRGWVGYVEGLLPAMLSDTITEDEVVQLATMTLLAAYDQLDGVHVPGLES